MAQANNTVHIVGNLTREPELRFTPNGQATATFGVAVNRTWVDRQSQERRESTSFFDVVSWGTLAENAATSLARGMRVVVIGRLDQRSWETQEGERRSKIEITADEIAPSLRWSSVKVTKNERRSPEPPNGEVATAEHTQVVAEHPPFRAPAHEPAPVGYGADHEDEEPF